MGNQALVMEQMYGDNPLGSKLGKRALAVVQPSCCLSEARHEPQLFQKG